MEEKTYDELQELYNLAIKSNDYRRAVALKQEIRARDEETEQLKQLRDAVKVLDMFGITGNQYTEILTDLHKGEDDDD